LAFTLIVALWALVGCDDAQDVDPASDPEITAPDPAPDPEVTAPDAVVRLVGEAKADLILYVSNQSFDDEEVRLTVTIDQVTVVEGDFHVEGQHNWIRFPLRMSAGGHEVTAESDSGATLRESFDLLRDKTSYAVIDHWTEDGSADLTWIIQRQPMAFL
jgi:hypothetical protein